MDIATIQLDRIIYSVYFFFADLAQNRQETEQIMDTKWIYMASQMRKSE